MTSFTAAEWSSIMAAHDNYWEAERAQIRLHHLAYEVKFWDKAKMSPNTLAIETSRGYEFIEGYIASLFGKNLAVVLSPDLRAKGNPGIAQSLANQYLLRIRTIVEDTSRIALIAPSAAVKLYPQQSDDPYQRIGTLTISPWDVIVDSEASTWEAQRYIGHRYWLPVAEAQQKWGRKDYASEPKRKFLDNTSDKVEARRTRGVKKQTREGWLLHEYVEVVEVYDLLADRVCVWSRHYADGQKWLDSGKATEVEGVEDEVFNRIPFRFPDGSPCVPIAPLYFSRKPDDPLRGMSAMHRIYDQIVEINCARTYQAAEVRKCARQYLSRKGSLTPTARSQISQGVDGEHIEVDLQAGQSLSDIIYPVPHAPSRPEMVSYVAQVQDDLSRGTVLAPFTRGEATKGATATEVAALASYSASEIGRLARERDGLIEHVARIYLAMMSLYIEDNDVVRLDGKVTVVKPSDLQGDFGVFAQDGGSTPASDQVRKMELANAVPMLLQLGVAPDQILAEVVRRFGLPETFTVAPKPDPESTMPALPGVTDAPV